MNKPQYLAELSRLLVFMTYEDREQTVACYSDLFDRVGPGGADALIARIGSPTMVSIRLSRNYEPGLVEAELMAEQADIFDDLFPTFPDPAAAPDAEAAVPEDDGLPGFDLPPLEIDDLPDYDLPPLEPEEHPADPDAAPAEEPEPDEPAETVQTPEPDALPAEKSQPVNASAPDTEPRPVSEPKEEPEPKAVPRDEPEIIIERAIPLWAGIPLFILSVLLLGIPFAVLCLILIPVFLAPGLATLLGAWLAAVGGIWCISYIADAIMLFGLAFVILAVGLVVLWFGLWLDVMMVKLYISACRGVTHLTLGKKVTGDA